MMSCINSEWKTMTGGTPVEERLSLMVSSLRTIKKRCGSCLVRRVCDFGRVLFSLSAGDGKKGERQ